MAQSSTVATGDTIEAAHHNNLRDDAISASTGHYHDGTNGRGNAAFALEVAGLPLTLENTTNATSNQLLIIRGDNSTRADNDEIYVTFSLDDDGGNSTEFARVSAVATDVSNTTEDGRLDFGVITNGTLADELQLTGATLSPATSDGLALGTTSLMWADLFLASASVINFNSGDVTLTHAAGKLTWGGDGAVEIDFNNHEMTNVDIDSGAIDGTTIGASSVAAGSFAAIAGTTGTFTGVLSLPDGAADAPAITNTGDTNAGLYFSAADTLAFTAVGTAQFTMADGAITPVTTNDIDLGTASLEFKDAFFDGTVTADAFAGSLTGNVTGNTSGTAATVTGAAQSAITSTGTLTSITTSGHIQLNNEQYLKGKKTDGTVVPLIGIDCSERVAIEQQEGLNTIINNLTMGSIPAPDGNRWIAFADGIAPGSMGSNSAAIFANDNSGTVEMYAIDEANNVAQLTPHPNTFLATLDSSFELPWAHHTKNNYLGKEIHVDMYGAVKAVEDLLVAAGTPKTLIYVEALSDSEKRDWYDDQQAKKVAWDVLRANDLTDGMADMGAFTLKHPPQWLQDRGVRQETVSELAARGL